jgi:hypothetical protein
VPVRGVERHGVAFAQRSLQTLQRRRVLVVDQHDRACGAVEMDGGSVFGHAAREPVGAAAVSDLLQTAPRDRHRTIAVGDERAQCGCAGACQRWKAKLLGLEHSVDIESHQRTGHAALQILEKRLSEVTLHRARAGATHRGLVCRIQLPASPEVSQLVQQPSLDVDLFSALLLPRRPDTRD